jgi:hypothetical protein
MRGKAIVAALIVSVVGTAAAAAGLPPVPPELVNVAAVTCIRVDEAGAINGAFILRSTGDPAKDRALLGWVRQLHWDKAAPGEKRGEWFPMPIAIGTAVPPEMPKSCAPPVNAA